MAVQISEKELNRLYSQINFLYKEGKISTLGDVEIPSRESNKKLIFRFDPSMGSKGAWVVKTDIEVNHEIWEN